MRLAYALAAVALAGAAPTAAAACADDRVCVDVTYDKDPFGGYQGCTISIFELDAPRVDVTAPGVDPIGVGGGTLLSGPHLATICPYEESR